MASSGDGRLGGRLRDVDRLELVGQAVGEVGVDRLLGEVGPQPAAVLPGPREPQQRERLRLLLAGGRFADPLNDRLGLLEGACCRPSGRTSRSCRPGARCGGSAGCPAGCPTGCAAAAGRPSAPRRPRPAIRSRSSNSCLRMIQVRCFFWLISRNSMAAHSTRRWRSMLIRWINTGRPPPRAVPRAAADERSWPWCGCEAAQRRSPQAARLLRIRTANPYSLWCIPSRLLRYAASAASSGWLVRSRA